ncbi:MAG: DUF3336 domain-containing protein [SAR324 cluster bacterium]|nr:DUF3336 domain-containing protein [SAR324 cluster bacterium]MBF0350069.1 DUF3336 domain-containing protein [SAR324 cluster bacterium]
MQRRNAVELKQAMAQSTDYQSWYTTAVEYDWLKGHEAWKVENESPDYLYKLILKRLNHLRACYKAKDIPQLVYSLREGLKRNIGNIANPVLYNHARVGTKYLIDDYIHEVSTLLKYLAEEDLKQFSLKDKLKFFRQSYQGYGRSALLLSGGSTMGMFHVGVFRALFEQGLLPRVISGSSAGSIMTSVFGVKTEEEMWTLHREPEQMLAKNIFQRLPWAEIAQGKGILSSKALENFLRDTIGEYTFEEAFERTGRMINISISPLYQSQHPRLANYLTTPHVLIWSACLASCTVPGVFAPVELTAKNIHGEYVTHMKGVRWVDGSVTNDIPIKRLSELFNVNHYIVSQVNPHITPFMEQRWHTKDIRWNMRDLFKSEAKHRGLQLLKLFGAPKYGNRLSMLGMLNSVLDQQYQGDINIFPKLGVKKYLRLFANPDVQEFRAALLEGERATWPHIAMIKNETLVGLTLEKCLLDLEQQERQPVQIQGPRLYAAS